MGLFKLQVPCLSERRWFHRRYAIKVIKQNLEGIIKPLIQYYFLPGYVSELCNLFSNYDAILKLLQSKLNSYSNWMYSKV